MFTKLDDQRWALAVMDFSGSRNGLTQKDEWEL
jgi:hypothetical protein